MRAGTGAGDHHRYAVPKRAENSHCRRIRVPGYDVSSWYGLYAPAKTPLDIVKKINADVVAMLRAPAMQEKFAPLGVLVASSMLEELAAKNTADAALWGPIIKEANIKVE